MAITSRTRTRRWNEIKIEEYEGGKLGAVRRLRLDTIGQKLQVSKRAPETKSTKEFVLSEHTRESAFTTTTHSTTVYVNLKS